MQKNLVIVESPAKAKTIEKFLGSDYKVLPSYGHIRDLKNKGLSIDINNDFKPEYVISPDKVEVVKQLRKATKAVETVWLASDEDREGEAIAWHLYIVLGLQESNSRRIVFHEITKNAILNAIEHPRHIDLRLVNAQQARRVLDRIVGFELSPILWKKIMPSLSAGRVQSVAVRLIVEREREINNFITESFFRIRALFYLPNNKIIVQSELNKHFKTEEGAKAFLETLKDAIFTIDDINIRSSKKSPTPPFITSTLQQEAANKAGFSISQTMSIAQKLYDSGLITYMRTDSLNLSSLALNDVQKEIIDKFGDRYVKIRQYQTKIKGAQEAHEAIRPTYISNRMVAGTVQEQRLYQLIWERTIASQMADAELEKTMVTIGISNNAIDKFHLQGEVVKFDGFFRAHTESIDSKNAEAVLPPMQLNEILNLTEATASEHLTRQPLRYTEASLVRKLEKLGIGRPSTYAPIISTIQQRGYVIKGAKEGKQKLFTTLTLKNKIVSKQTKTEIVGADKNKLIPSDSGIIVNDFLIEHFPIVLEYNFTADLEKEFDKIAEGQIGWIELLHKFYNLFHPIVEKVSFTQIGCKVGERILGTDKNGKPISVKIGRFGSFVQIGSAEDEEKPQFASLVQGQSIESITLEEALALFDLPRTVGIVANKPVIVTIGRFGPYMKFDNAFISIPKEYDPYHITIEEAEKLIKEKKERDANKIIKFFSENNDLKVLNGRFGAYIAYKKNNYKIPRGIVPEIISYDDAMEIIEKNPKRKRGNIFLSRGKKS
ncbi:MAG: type I DNA topoisomerase [Candidatus Azobacteroides pseudotrichonymphae]|jgi:DNA topoisomerase-1|nr:type I DNA topoisomerase [Bacteroidales bacterium OttesenSCG-928-I14]GMO36144.1 MAG: type I DNA topoisomerase [Candidatus Azobacteroides pseudotrichonymphae]